MSIRAARSIIGSFLSLSRVFGLSVGWKSMEVGPFGNHGMVWATNHTPALRTGPNVSRERSAAETRISPSTSMPRSAATRATAPPMLSPAR